MAFRSERYGILRGYEQKDNVAASTTGQAFRNDLLPVFTYFVYMWYRRVWGSQRPPCRSSFSFSTMWVWGLHAGHSWWQAPLTSEPFLGYTVSTLIFFLKFLSQCRRSVAAQGQAALLLLFYNPLPLQPHYTVAHGD